MANQMMHMEHSWRCPRRRLHINDQALQQLWLTWAEEPPVRGLQLRQLELGEATVPWQIQELAEAGVDLAADSPGAQVADRGAG
mmetsp:Transcript_39125/g.92038  ORF Transcript_39125/g.92038 Transcript_39125/m.92038 type:complete len:84 (-) Transcript_39125:811-1062(-)